MQIRVVSRDSRPLLYSSEYGSTKSPPYVEIVDMFQKDMARTFGGTIYAPRYVNTKVEYITHPKTVNSSWPDGLLFKYDVQTTPSKQQPIDKCDLWKQMMASLQRTNGVIGGHSLRIADDSELLNPCRTEEPLGECGGKDCNLKLGEICIAGSVCGCPVGMRRAASADVCRAVESWNVPLLVIRKEHTNLIYNDSFANPMDSTYKSYVRDYERGIGGCYPHTTLRNAFVAADVNEIVNPRMMNASWESGLLFNTTVHFRKGAVRIPSDVYYELVRYIIERNGYEVGDSGLYLNEYQPNPYKPCFKNDCHPKGICYDVTDRTYRCECGAGFRELDPSDPGKKCVPVYGFNECEKKEDNECSENARCIDLEHLYKCECLPSYSDAAPPGAVPGLVSSSLLYALDLSRSVCVLDYCSDVNFCPTNTTCKNMEQQAECRCDPGFTDIRRGGAWPWSTLEGSSSSESGAEFSALSAAGHDYYPDIGIPRAKLKAGAVAADAGAKSMDVARLEQYLSDGAVRIPRAHLVGSSGRLNETCDSMSSASSEYTIKEEIERKASRTSVLVGDSSSYAARNAEYSNAAAFSDRQYRHSGAEERERGESVAEFSIGRAKSKDYLTRERDVVEYSSEQDMSQSEEHEVGDVHTRVSHSHHYEPIRNGESERFRSEMVTSQKSTSVTKH
ncbi:EGF-like domain protein [Teladorsagia circumcincta]|uniref:EGF-like domain protein n=1 Tax=Teladorsagia circumcincta TaxID=45464 RepID=A0A2G9UK17_TELCI|nr:EGF-like domain protein [Teladorsagia circumcincta]